MCWIADPFISIVPVLALKVPLFMIDPDICSLFPERFRDEPLSMVRFLTDPEIPPFKTGLLVTLGIITFVIWSGTVPQDQFAATFQSVPANPVHIMSDAIVTLLVAVTLPQP